MWDTSFVIDWPWPEVTAALPEEVAIAAVTLAELAAGPHLASSAGERARRQVRLQQVEAAFAPLPYTAADRCAWGSDRLVLLEPHRVWHLSPTGATLCGMPTTRPRLAVTETDAIARALDLAAQRWPTKTRAQLLARLVEEGARHLEDDEARRRSVIQATSGALTGVYSAGYLAELRQDWPA